MAGPHSRIDGGGTVAPREDTSAEAAALLGTVLPGRFRIDEVIARGGFGTVYRAHQLAVGRDVAVKVLHASIAPDSRAGRLFVQEIQAVGRLDHAHVVRIFQADVTPDGRLFYAMELLSGRDLEQVTRDDVPVPPTRALALIRQLLAGLAAVHDAGLVHADVKPANALVVGGRDGERLVLVDFGLARLRPTDQPARSAGGTPAYMAPEQLHSGRVDARSDVFAATLVLVTLLTGWRRRSAAMLVPSLDEIADLALRSILARALAIDPAERPQSADELSRALAGLEAGGAAIGARRVLPDDRGNETSAAPVAVVGASAAWHGRARGGWLLALVAVVALGALAVVWRTRDRDQAPITDDSAWPPPPPVPETVMTYGSLTVLRGLLAPVRELVEQRGRVALPLRDEQDIGSGGAMNMLWAVPKPNDTGPDIVPSDLAATSLRWSAAVPEHALVEGLVVEVAVGFDETAVFIHRDNPLQELDVAAFRAGFCCARGTLGDPVAWRTLDPTVASNEQVAWLLYGRVDAAVSGSSTSATLTQADRWLCAPDLLCPSNDPRITEANHVLPALADSRHGIALSGRAFADARVHEVALIDRKRGLRFDGRKVLWLYLAAHRARPISAKLCRVLDVLLSDDAAAALTRAQRAEPLPPDQRRAQRTWLGLDDHTCETRPAGALAVDDRRVAASPIAGDLTPEPWVALPPAP